MTRNVLLCLIRKSFQSDVEWYLFYFIYIDTDEIPGFLLLLKNHIFTTRSEDTIFIFHMWGYWCGHGYQHYYRTTIALLAQAHSLLIWNFIHKMASRCEDGRVIEFSSSLLQFWLFRTENISITFFISPLYPSFITFLWQAFCNRRALFAVLKTNK